MTVSDRIRIQNVRVLSDNHYLLKTTTFEWRRANGEWQTQHRETYDRGNGATLLPYNLAQRTGGLGRPFRYPAYGHRCVALFIPAPARRRFARMGDGRIADAKPIMLLQYAALNIFR